MTKKQAQKAAQREVYIGPHEDGTWLIDTYGSLVYDVRPQFSTYFTYREALAERRRVIAELIELLMKAE